MATINPRHRRSIFSGLLLIIIGALLLSHNFGGSLPAWEILRQWWPLVFILWGLTKLYDHFMAQRTGEPAPPTVSAGEVILVLLLLAVIGGLGIIDWGTNHPTVAIFFHCGMSRIRSQDRAAASSSRELIGYGAHRARRYHRYSGRHAANYGDGTQVCKRGK